MNNNSFIPVNEPLLNGKEKGYLNQAIDSGWISSEGPFVRNFEKKFSSKVNRKFGIAVCNGSAALEVAVNAIGIKAGDEVIMPNFTIISCALPVVRIGAKPILIDADPFTFNMNVENIESKISDKTKAIMVVHIYGLPVDMDPILSLAKKYNLKIIEDAAEMHGQTYKGKSCGSFGDVSTFSFYPNKLITTGEGGMVVTDDEDIAEKSISLRNLYFDKDRKYIHEELGYNFRMTNLQAAIGLAQLDRYEEFIQKKRKIGYLYNQYLEDIPQIQLPVKNTDYAENIYWVYGIVLKDNLSIVSDKIIGLLKSKNIGARHFFYPMSKQPVFLKLGLFKNENYPESERLAEKGFYIPSGMALEEEQIERIAKVLKEISDEYF